jgi:hypothetical protein
MMVGDVEASTTTTTPQETAESGTEAHAGSQADAGAGADPGAGSTDTADERDETGRFMSREAANYRRRLRETEAERDQLRERLERYERAEVERLASAAGLQVAGDVWQFGATLDTLRGETGDIDPDTVTGVVGAILKDRPGLQARPAGDLGIGRGGTALGMRGPKVGLSQLLKPGHG